MAVDPGAVLDDLQGEYDDLDELLRGLEPEAWDAPTPAAGWAVRDQVFHLVMGEELAGLAASDADAFAAQLGELLQDLDGVAALTAEEAAVLAPAALQDRWRAASARTLAALRAAEPRSRIPWVSGALTVASFATARLMETWAHGRDIRDAVGIHSPPTARLRHVAHLGVATRGFSYRNRGIEPPPVDVRVELAGPGGERWVWGAPGPGGERVTGTVEDFCLVVTQRRNLADTDLEVRGEVANEWMRIAQAFAGPATDGPIATGAGSVG